MSCIVNALMMTVLLVLARGDSDQVMELEGNAPKTMQLLVMVLW